MSCITIGLQQQLPAETTHIDTAQYSQADGDFVAWIREMAAFPDGPSVLVLMRDIHIKVETINRPIMKANRELRHLDLNLLVAFDALLREGSVTRAAASLDLTQSAMSHSLARLRAFFDDPLFVKTQGGVAPTAQALALSTAIQEVVQTIRVDVLSQAQFDPEHARRTFTFCMSDLGELVFLPTLLARIRREAPHCTIHTRQIPTGQLPAILGAGEADLAIGALRDAPEDLYQQELFTHTFVCIVNPRNPEIGEQISLEQFSRTPQVVVTLPGRDNIPYDSAIDAAGVKRVIKVKTPHFLVVPLLLAQHPDLISTVPRSMGTVFASHDMVRPIEPPLDLPSFALRQYWHPRFHRDQANIWLRTLVKQTFEQMPPSPYD